MNRILDREQRILRYNPALRESEVRAEFESPSDPMALIESDRRKYEGSGAIKMPHWQEVIAAVRSVQEADPRDISFDLTTSFAVQARRAAYIADSRKDRKSVV